MIKALRIDDRLLHGQVAAAWTPFLGVDTILIANDRLMTDKTMQIAFKLATPPGIILSMKSLDGAIEVVNNPKNYERKIMIIVESIKDAAYICKHAKNIEKIIIGGQREEQDKKKIESTVYLSEEDVEMLAEITESGTEVILQTVPTAPKIRYDEIKRRFYK